MQKCRRAGEPNPRPPLREATPLSTAHDPLDGTAIAGVQKTLSAGLNPFGHQVHSGEFSLIHARRVSHVIAPKRHNDSYAAVV